MEDKQATRTTRRPTRRIHETRNETIAGNRMRRRDRPETASKQARNETKDETHGRDEKRDGPTDAHGKNGYRGGGNWFPPAPFS